ncbi:MAG: hypothetical protein FWH27_16240 [Planctomycetaceae bacterium]|nr:hypothetical protein [Planctomycetaceae bacterium]
MADIIQRVYFPDRTYFANSVFTTDFANSYRDETPPLSVFGNRVLLDAGSKTVRDINELIFMLSHEGKLPARLERIEAKNAALEEKLQQPVTLSMEEVPFAEFLDHLPHELEIAVYVDKQAFYEEDYFGNPLDWEISLDVTNLPAISALELALCQVEDTWYYFHDGILEITPTAVVNKTRAIYPRVYFVADLLTGGCGKTYQIDDLIATLQILFRVWDRSMINYDDDGDERFFMPFQEKTLVAHLTQKEHKKLEALLHAMRYDGFYPPAQQARLDANQELYAKLQTEISVDFEHTPLSEMLQSLKEQTRLTFFVDIKAFENEDILFYPSDEEVTLRMRNQSVETVLNYALRQLDREAGFVAWNGVVCIVPQIVCENRAEPLFFVYPAKRLANQEPERFPLTPENGIPPSRDEPPEVEEGASFSDDSEDDFGFSPFD